MFKSLIAAILITCLIAASSVAYRDYEEKQSESNIENLTRSLMMLSKRCKSLSEIEGKLNQAMYKRCLTIKHPKSFYNP